MTSRGNHGSHCLLSMIFLHLLLVVTPSISHSGDITRAN